MKIFTYLGSTVGRDGRRKIEVSVYAVAAMLAPDLAKTRFVGE